MASAAQLLDLLPDGYELTIRSWHDGERRQYLCSLTSLTDRNKAWSGQSGANIESAITAAMLAADLPIVDSGFWRGARIATPMSLGLWLLLAAVAVVLWFHIY